MLVCVWHRKYYVCHGLLPVPISKQKPASALTHVQVKRPMPSTLQEAKAAQIFVACSRYLPAKRERDQVAINKICDEWATLKLQVLCELT